MLVVNLAHRTLRRRHTHSTIAKRIAVKSHLFPGHIERMDRIRLTPDFERHVDLSCAINDPDIPT